MAFALHLEGIKLMPSWHPLAPLVPQSLGVGVKVWSQTMQTAGEASAHAPLSSSFHLTSLAMLDRASPNAEGLGHLQDLRSACSGGDPWR